MAAKKSRQATRGKHGKPLPAWVWMAVGMVFGIGLMLVVVGKDWTGIYITPGYRFRAVDALITNFHLPESTLLMLVSALTGREEALRCYEHAIKERYRFFSFGDAMLIL